jgi:glycerol-3-phosphate acyltransferase PlsY
VEWKLAALSIISYLIGSFPTGVVISRRRFGIDVRDMGSGNIGATNITRNFGWRAGLFTFLVDFFKGYLVIEIALLAFARLPWVETVAGASVVLGHCYSAFLRLRGGKGVATSMGCLLAAVPVAGAVFGVTYLVMIVITRISAVGSLVGMGAACVYMLIVPPAEPIQWMVYFSTAIVLVRHGSNFRRLWKTLLNY